MKTKFKSGEVDRTIGARIRAARRERGFSQAYVAGRVGVSYQQLHKYETGENRIAASLLCGVAEVLAFLPSHFVEGVTAEPRTTPVDPRLCQIGRWFGRMEDKDRGLLHHFAKIIAAGREARS